MSTIAFSVLGEPVPKQSFRIGKDGGYTDPRVKVWQDMVAASAMIAKNENQVEIIDGPVTVAIDFYLGNRRRIDLDNLSKAVLDGLKGVIFVDDQQVIGLYLRKFIKKNAAGLSGAHIIIREYKEK
jgi:Holliday junction resolvase RusA-like endonuclease